VIQLLGAQLIRASFVISEFFDLIFQVFSKMLRPPFRYKETLQQIYFVANGSVHIIVFCVCFAAMVAILESAFHMKMVIQNDSMVPGFASMLILRELGAVVTALLLTSRVGAGIAAEIGLMKVTEQIDALKMLGIDPVKFLVVPRWIACFLSGIVLTIIANMVCLYAAMIVSDVYLGYTQGVFLATMNRFVDFSDLVYSVIKGACFGAVIPLIASYYGFRCEPGADGVGAATTNSVVASSVAIIIIDFFLSFIFSLLG
jgi:phospholipid/cholesterol/gamma-HCH transport system permease protein